VIPDFMTMRLIEESGRSLAHDLRVHFDSFRGTLAPSWPSRKSKTGLIYIVDDEPDLTNLYELFLDGTGYAVEAFNHRVEALDALNINRRKPDLLIMDYLGHSIPADQFLNQCLRVHPNLRILVASGLTDIHFASVKPHHVLQKPFNGEEFVNAVRSVLSA